MRSLLHGMAVVVVAVLAVPSSSAPHGGAAAASCSASSAPKKTAKQGGAPKKGNGLTPTYKRMRAAWHMAPPPTLRKRWLVEENPPLVIKPVHASVSFELRPDPRTGLFGEEAQRAAMAAFHWKTDGSEHPVDDRLLDLMYRAAKRYKAPYVHLVSGYRNRDGRSSSRHNQGRAADIVLPGVGDAQLAAFFRRQGFVGVGHYPISGFTHIDVRERSYYWVDRSGPGQKSRERPVRGQDVAMNDAQARKRGERATPSLVPRPGSDEEVLASAESSGDGD
jgi:uncharacterized protein YcbK (DUF882 family)